MKHTERPEFVHTPPHTDDDDEEFTIQEVRNVVIGMGKKKAPGEDGIPN